jgi:hypothetical protein
MNKEEIIIDNITEEDLDIIYNYLDMQFAFMNDEEKIMWIEIMRIIDKEFKENENSDA